jgi:hypothetical protein
VDWFGCNIKRLLNSREIDFKGRAFAYLAENVYVAAGLFDDCTTGRQP